MTNLPFDENVDDPEWLYRFQSVDRMNEMRDAIGDFIAPYHWGENAWPHESYANIAKKLKPFEAIYTISVWRNMASAYKEFNRCATPNAPKGILMRIPRKSVYKSNLKWEEDEHLPGEALLLYEVKEKKQCHPYGETRIPLSNLNITLPYWDRFHAVDNRKFLAVDSVYADEYSIDQLFENLSDVRIPWQENFIRLRFCGLSELDFEYKSVSRFRRSHRGAIKARINEIRYTIYSLCCESEEFRCAVLRLERHLPSDHHWKSYAREFGSLIRKSNAGEGHNLSRFQRF